MDYKISLTENNNLKFLNGNCRVNKYFIGDTYQGGKIAYFLKSGDPGYDVNEPHGLIIAPKELKIWAPEYIDITGTTDTIGTGLSNTNKILALTTDTDNGAYYCKNLTYNGYNDWFLPSFNEILAIHRSILVNNISGYDESNYMSSTQYNIVSYSITSQSGPLTVDGSQNPRTKTSLTSLIPTRYF